MTDLESMDELRKRMQVSYTQAKEALDQCEGDLAEALVYLEQRGFASTDSQGPLPEEETKEPAWDKEKTDHFIRGLIEQAKAIIQEGNVTKIRLISGEKSLIEIPATVGVVGLGVMLFSPLLFVFTAIGAATAVITEMAFEIEKSDGTVERRSLKFSGFGGKKNSGFEEPECDRTDADEDYAETGEDE